MKDSLDLSHHKALVTGASKGIGAATARMLADFGAEVFINYLEDKKEAEEVLNAILQAGGRSKLVQADVSKLSEVQKMAEETGSITLLVNNAGAILQPGSWDAISDDDFDRTIAVNLKGQFNCIKVFAPGMLQGGGRIINMSSTYGFMGAAPVIAYTVAKAGVMNLTKSFAKELAPAITVNCICPGIIDTAMTSAAGEEFVAQCVKETPAARLGKPEDIAGAVCFLASGLADFVTGEVLVVDGGHSLR